MQKEPRTQGEFNFLDAMKEVMKKADGKVSRKNLAERIGNHTTNVTEITARSHLSTFREYLEKEEPFKTEEEAEPPGNPTVYWRYDPE